MGSRRYVYRTDLKDVWRIAPEGAGAALDCSRVCR
jgi:hypothetical protein